MCKTNTHSLHHTHCPDKMEVQRCGYFVRSPTGVPSDAWGGPINSFVAQFSASIYNPHNPEFIYQTLVVVGVS